MDDGIKLYQSGLIPCGKAIYNITMDSTLESGTYNAILDYETRTNGYDIVTRLYDPNSQSYTSESGVTFNYVPTHSRMSSDTSVIYSGNIKFKISGKYY